MNGYKGPKITNPKYIKYITEPTFQFTILEKPEYLADLSGNRVYYKVSNREYIYGKFLYDHCTRKGYKWFQIFPLIVKPEPNFRGWSIEKNNTVPQDLNGFMLDFNLDIFFPANGIREAKKIYNVRGTIIKGKMKSFHIKPALSKEMEERLKAEMLNKYKIL
jgi:hypothetical protein